MKFVSWNVNGLRACVTKGFLDVFKDMDADFFCLQETKLQEGQIALDLPGYHQFWCSAQKKGYSGTAIFTRHQPTNVTYGLGIEELDTEGRLITLEYPEFYLVTCYTPNAQRGLARIEHRLKWEDAFRNYLMKLDIQKPVILCGDLNVAHKEIDLKNPTSNRGNAGFSDQERNAFTQLLDSGFTDTFRHLYPEKTGAYSWWSYMFNARQNNAGWRIDYFLVSNRLQDTIHDATIHPDVMGSDHCPVGLDLNITCNGGIRIPVNQFETTENKQTAGGTSTGSAHLRKRIVIGATAIVLLLCASIFLFRKHFVDPNHTDPEAAVPALSSSNLVYKCEQLTKDARFMYVSGNDETIHRYIICNSERWDLGEYPLEFDYTSSLLRPSPNIFLQVMFNPDYPFTETDAPKVQLTSNESFYTAYYYEEDRIAGCFIIGNATTEAGLSFEVTYGDISIGIHMSCSFPAIDYQLYSEVIYHQEPIEVIRTPAENLLEKPYIQLVAPDHTWEMYKELIIGSQCLNCTPNFFVQIVFPDDSFYNEDNYPGTGIYNYNDDGDHQCHIQYMFYYGDNGYFGGMFVFGYTVSYAETTLQLNSQDTRNDIPIFVIPDIDYLATPELIQLLSSSNLLRGFLPFISSLPNYTLEDCIATAPVQALLAREDCIDAMLDQYEVLSPRERLSCNISVLLNHNIFLSKMTDTQKTRYQSLGGFIAGD